MQPSKINPPNFVEFDNEFLFGDLATNVRIFTLISRSMVFEYDKLLFHEGVLVF